MASAPTGPPERERAPAPAAARRMRATLEGDLRRSGGNTSARCGAVLGHLLASESARLAGALAVFTAASARE